MIEPHAHLGFAPRGAGLLYAVMWFERRQDVFGWFAGERDGHVLTRYFWLEQYYAPAGSRARFSAGADLHGDWVESRLGQPELPSVGPDEDVLHGLAQAQEVFVRHWLVADDGSPAARAAADALQCRELPVRPLNIRPDRLNKLAHGAALWTHDGPGADRHVLDHLSRRWPLEHRIEA